MAALTALAIASIATSAYGIIKDATRKSPAAPTLPTAPAAPTPVDAGPVLTAQKKVRTSGGIASGRSSTLLTGPAGATAPAAVERKTLLGM